MADPIYALIMLAAIATGILATRLSPQQLPLSRRENLWIAFGAFCGAMLGAKLPFVLSDWDGFLSGWAWFSNGKTILCGLVGGYFGVELAKWELGVRTKTGDFFAVPVALAVGIGRLGCFHAGCCYGTPTNVPWGVVFPNVDELPRHPTQLYESAFHLSMAAVLFVLQRRGLFRGQLFKLYILSYLVYRFFTEMIRPGARLAGGLTGYQWVSLVLFGLFAWLWMRDAASLREGAALRA
ncbi:MAG TPA: prolipoprotein diacylglyceryl transferase [Lacipirellulaceae bacterium]|nr:prolipoprotein diacylglyceryl transferase [Lacipirellulaceae bacterium]